MSWLPLRQAKSLDYSKQYIDWFDHFLFWKFFVNDVDASSSSIYDWFCLSNQSEENQHSLCGHYPVSTVTGEHTGWRNWQVSGWSSRTLATSIQAICFNSIWNSKVCLLLTCTIPMVHWTEIKTVFRAVVKNMWEILLLPDARRVFNL